MAYRRKGLGSSPIPLPVTSANYTDCGGGLSVQVGTPCPPAPAPYTPAQQAAIAQGQLDYNARAARCKTYQSKEYAIDAASGLVAALLLPGWWKLLALPIAIAVEIKYPRSPDCDYGF